MEQSIERMLTTDTVCAPRRCSVSSSSRASVHGSPSSVSAVFAHWLEAYVAAASVVTPPASVVIGGSWVESSAVVDSSTRTGR